MLDLWRQISSDQAKFFLIGVLFFMAGIVVGSIVVLDIFIAFCFLLFLIFSLFIFWSNIGMRIILIWILFFMGGLIRFNLAMPNFDDPDKIYYYHNQEVAFSGLVVKVDQRLNGQRLTLKSRKLASGQSVAGRVLVISSLYPVYSYGDYLSVSCRLSRPQPYEDFDYERYLSRYDIYVMCFRPEITKLDDNQGNLMYATILRLKQQLSQGLNLSVPEPQAAILQAMVLGNRRGITANWLDKFSQTGISHIIAISGLHITIITMILMRLAIGLGLVRQKAFWLALLGISLYIVMIGLPASAVRAGIMALLVLYAGKIGRLSSSANAVFMAAALMLLVNPKLLLADVGFQLSFMAVLGIIYLAPIFKNKLKNVSDGWQVKEIIIITLSAQIMTLPLIIFYFNQWSLVSLLANVAILPLVPLMMIFGIVSAILGAVFLPLGQMVGFVSWLLVGYLMWVVNWLSALPLAYLPVKNFGWLEIIVCYFLIGLIFIKPITSRLKKFF